jgi:AcrR family transcriptional regulator
MPKLSRGSGEGRTPRRAYRMRKRGELVDRTRRRITEAAVRLHTSVGPSVTSMSAVADEAGITRLTLYRHFPSKDELFGACMSHWRALHPPPDPERWRAISPFEARVRTAIAELYRWYAENGDDLYPIYRDAAHTPESTLRARQANNERMTDAVLADLDVTPAVRRRVRAALGHVIGFWTWRSLAVDQGLSTEKAAAMAARFVLAAL